MKISGVEVFPVLGPMPQPGGHVRRFLRLDTGSGLPGYGELGPHRELVDYSVEWKEGYVVPSVRPWLGCQLNEDSVPARELQQARLMARGPRHEAVRAR